VPEELAGTATGPGGRSRLYRRGLKERRRRWSRRCLRIKGAASRNEAPLEGHECIIVFVAAGATPPRAVRIVAASVVLRSPFALSELPSAPGHLASWNGSTHATGAVVSCSVDDVERRMEGFRKCPSVPHRNL
jgi:hypothetical protein